MKLSEQLALINLSVCDAYRVDYRITRPHNLKLIEKQVVDLRSKGEAYAHAYAAYMVARLRPFATNNSRTAALYLLSLHPSTQTPKLVMALTDLRDAQQVYHSLGS